MSSSAIRPLRSSLSSDQHLHKRQQLPPMSFRSSVGSKPSASGPVEGAAAPATATADLAMKPAVGSGGGGIGTSGYLAGVTGTLGSSWISRLRRPSPQPPPAQAAETSPSVATAWRSAATEGSGVAGGERGSDVPVPVPIAHPSSLGPEPAAFFNSAYHVQRLCLSPLGLDDNLHSNGRQQQQRSPQQPVPRQVTVRVRGFGPFRFSDVRDHDPLDGVKGNRLVMPPDRSPPPPPPPHPHPLPSHSQHRATAPVPNPWVLAPDGADAGRLNPRPSGFFPLFAKMVRAGEEALHGAPKTTCPPSAVAEVSVDVKPPPVVLRQRHLRTLGAGKEPFAADRATPHHQPGERSTRMLPLLTNNSTGASTVRLPSDGSSGRSSFLSRQITERLSDPNPASSAQSLTDAAVFPAEHGGGGRWRGLPGFGSSKGPVATTSNACLPVDPRRTNAAILGNAEDRAQVHQLFNKDTTAISNNRKSLASSRLPPAAAACGSEDRYSFWNMGRFWPSSVAAPESLSRKRLHAPDAAVVSPLKCRKLGNQG